MIGKPAEKPSPPMTIVSFLKKMERSLVIVLRS
jgi:hypothetical protein